MKGKVLFGVLGMLFSLRGEAENAPETKKQETWEEWLLKNHTPEEKDVVDVPLALTLEKKEELPPGHYRGTIVFELVRQ